MRGGWGSIAKAGESWRARIKDLDGHRLSFTAPTRRLCQDWLDAQRKRKLDASLGVARAAPEPVRFAALVADWLDTLASRGVRPTTAKMYRNSAPRMLAEFGDAFVHEITPPAVARWSEKLAADGLALTTVARFVACLSAAMRHALRRGMLEAVPKLERPRGATAVRREAYTPEEVDALLRKLRADPVAYAAGLLALDGLRRGEICRLRRVDVHEDELRVDIVSRPAAPTKSGRSRSVDISRETMRALRELKYRRDGLALGVAESTLNARVHKVTGAPCLHSLRHTAATRSAAAGATVWEMMDRFGWTEPAMAARYYHGPTAAAWREARGSPARGDPAGVSSAESTS